LDLTRRRRASARTAGIDENDRIVEHRNVLQVPTASKNDNSASCRSAASDEQRQSRRLAGALLVRGGCGTPPPFHRPQRLGRGYRSATGCSASGRLVGGCTLVHLTLEQFRALREAGVIGNVEYLGGRMVMNGIPMTLSPEQLAVAAGRA
jgi:hypothetical protein